MGVTALQSFFPRIPRLSLPIAVGVGAWKLVNIVGMLAGSTSMGIISGFLFFVMAMTAHHCGRARSLKWRLIVFAIVYLFKVGPASVESIVIHHGDIAQSRMVLPSSLAQGQKTDAQREALGSGCQSLVVADDIIYLAESQPLDILLAILITWITFVGVDALALLLDYFAFISEDASRLRPKGPTTTENTKGSQPSSGDERTMS